MICKYIQKITNCNKKKAIIITICMKKHHFPSNKQVVRKKIMLKAGQNLKGLK